MGRSNPRGRSASPVKHYFSWKAGEGFLSFYDKEKNADVNFQKLHFMLLEGDMHSVGGFSKEKNTGIRGSEIRNTAEEEIQVYYGRNKGPKGLYSDLKNSVSGLKYMKPLYIAVITASGDVEVAKLELQGASVGAWINFLNGKEEYAENGRIDPYENSIFINGRGPEKKNGATSYFEPVFEVREVTEEQNQKALALDKELEEFLSGRATKSPVESVTTTSSSSADTSEDVPNADGGQESVAVAKDVRDLPF